MPSEPAAPPLSASSLPSPPLPGLPLESLGSFDFVIVGAGSAGSVLAERLSADGRFTVAILEAGGSDRRFFVQMPLGYGKTFYDPALNWGYHSEPDPGLAGRKDYWPRGKVLGGSSSLNAMVWMRGHRLDFDDWAKEGNAGWGYADCLPYFKAIEHNEAGADEFRGRGGRQHVSDVSQRLHPLAKRFLAAGREAGLTFNPDFNGAEQDGVGIYQITTKGGWRMSAARAFLRPALKRPNVALFSKTHGIAITFDGQRANGLEVLRGDRKLRIQARREVILAAGAVNSPVLLQLSGIGPAEHLAALGIAVRRDSPAIGRHLQDHLGINYTYRARVPTLNDVLRPWWGKLAAGMAFLLAGRGPLSLSLNQGGGFIRTREGLDRPNIQLYFQAISTLGAKSGTRPLTNPDPFPGFSIGLSTCKPESRGSILIRSTDPRMAPAITANAFSTPRDVQDMLEGVKFLRHLAAQPAFADVIAEELAPGPAITSDEALIADFRARSGTVYHPCGTCRMGPLPSLAALDSRLRLYGFEGLRVADASVFPSVISGNTNAPVMMVAARAAAMALEDARADKI